MVHSITNDYIRVDVSADNGGFCIANAIGDKLNKADDNKNLLFHNGEYDTSFTSFQVTFHPGTASQTTKEYIFGGDYGFLGMSSSDVTVTANAVKIDAVWTVDSLTFTQSISLANAGANEHGMVCISYTVSNAGSIPVSVKARVLLDTSLGDQDFAYYEVVDSSDHYRRITTETVLTASDSIPQNFFGYDDPYNPSITAYTVSTQTDMPYQAAFGHWNNLASTVFGFTPDASMDFTDKYNAAYLTADSAYALYYNLNGSSPVLTGESTSFLTYYGVFSHSDVPAGSGMTVDVTSPTSLSLTPDRTAFARQTSQGVADFAVQAEMVNFVSDKAKDRSSVTLAIFTASGLMPLNANGGQVSGLTYDGTDPYTITYADISIGETISDTLYFKARLDSDAQYRKTRLEVYDTSSNATITAENLLGSAVFYVLCPGTGGDLPVVTFSAMNPTILYCSGNRHLFLTGTNIDFLYTSLQNGNCTIKGYTKDENDNESISVLKGNVLQPDPNILDLILPDTMVPGSWYLQLEWSDNAIAAGIVSSADQKQTAPALQFTISDDVKYKNDTYGVIAVVQTQRETATTHPVYRIKSFSGESTFKSYQQGTLQADGVTYLKDYVEILMVFRGEFEVKETTTEGGAVIPTLITATSLKSSADAEATNSISINNCIDFENGVLTIGYESILGSIGDVRVEFNGELYTTGALTSIWKGEAAFTEIEQGLEFSLIPYDQDGNRSDQFTDKPVSLVWPSVFGVGQTIAGMVFNLAYGQLGVMNDADGAELGRVISFSAKLDLGFLIPSKENDETENTYWTRLKNFWKFYNEGKGGMYSYWAVENVDNILDFSNEVSGKDKGAAAVMVQDILYGCGTGFVGVHFKADLALPNYVPAMPKIEAALEVNTIGNWSFALDGKMELATFALEVSLAIKSYNNIPVPDKIYFFVGGFEPGINVDTCGVVWITGGGGGIDKLYDTIFMTSGLPPLQILLSVSFDLLKVLSARADFSVALTGISFSASDVKIKATNLVALKKAGLTFNWYPNLDLKASIRMTLFDIIVGSGYIVLEGKNYTDWFFEAFVRAGVNIPASIPLVGGMSVAGVDLGINAQKIWGALKVLSVKLGVTYYWGGNLNFGSGDTTQPTYPNLLGCDDIPVYYDADNDRTLYMRVGTNLSMAAMAEITDDFDGVPRLMGVTSLYSSGDRLTHRFDLGPRSTIDPDDAAVQITFSVANADGSFPAQEVRLLQAKAVADEILIGGIKDNANAKYVIDLYDGSNADTANANVTYDPLTGRGSLSFTMTDSSCYDKDWNFTTPVASDIILYHVAAVPALTSVGGTLAGSSLSLSWSGHGLSGLDSMRFYLTSDPTDLSGNGYALGELTDSASIASSAANFAVPADVPSGTYYVRAVYTQDGIVNDMITSSVSVGYVNANTPAEPVITSVTPGGDLKMNIGLSDSLADGYLVNIYEYVRDPDTGLWSWDYSDVMNMAFHSADIIGNTISVGGSYTYEEVARGLAVGVAYRVGVTAFNYVDTDSDGTDDTVVYGNERYYSAASSGVSDIGSATSVTLPVPTPPSVTIAVDHTALGIPRTVGTLTQTFDTYSASDLTFTASFGEAVTGEWSLDESDTVSGTFHGLNTVSIALSDLTEGDHTLVVKGRDAGGDGFRETRTFTVDTLAPRLLLSSPTDGSFFRPDGTLTITGITDADTRFTVACDGAVVCAGSSSSHHLTITASDAVGNAAGAEANVMHGGLSDLAEIHVYADGVAWSNGNLVTNALTQRTAQLALVAETNAGVRFMLSQDDLISWSCHAVEGTASITDDGLLTMGADSVGYATGALRVAASGSVSAGLTFGAERYSASTAVVIGTSLGGRVAGGGRYAAGETVTLTAIPDSGYYFTGWTISGVSVGDPTQPVISFTMPDGNVVATASFAVYYAGDPVYSVTAAAGEKLTFRLPAGANENRYVAYYLRGNEKEYVAMSAAVNGQLEFVAPIGGLYYFEQRNFAFSDTDNHWASDSIAFSAVRGLFDGTGAGQFSPDAPMTRAMFVTVLWRLAGKPSAEIPAFRDTETDLWYSQAVAWAAQNSIVGGYGDGRFGTNDRVTREQMSVIFLRYLKQIGMDLPDTATRPVGFTDEARISPWASDAVRTLHALGVFNGRDDGRFDPAAYATRAEVCTAFLRLIRAYLDSLS